MNYKEKEKKNLQDDHNKKLEILEILQKAKSGETKQLTLDSASLSFKEIDEVKNLIGQKMEDPEKKYQLFYKGIQKVLLKYLPRGKQYENERRIIHDEKLVFLNRGKKKNKDGIRKGDSRMTYNEDLSEMVRLIADWVSTSQDPVDLYQRLYDLNEKYGYGHQYYDETSKNFQKSMERTKKEKSALN